MSWRGGLVLLICLAGAALVFSGLAGIWLLHQPLVTRDLVGIQGSYLRGGGLLPTLLRTHVDHILAFQRLLAWADVNWLGAQQWAALAAIPLSCLAIALLAAAGAGRSAPTGARSARLAAALVVGSGLFWMGNGFNLVWAMQAHFFMAPAFTLAALTVLVTAPASLPRISLCLLLAALGGLSSGSGLIGCIALALVAPLLRLPRRQLFLLLLSLAAILAVILWLRGLTLRADARPAWPWYQDPWPVLLYLQNYLRAPAVLALRALLPAYQSGLSAAIAADLGLAALAAVWLRALLTGRRPTPLALQGLLLSLLSLGSGLVTALVRLQGGVEQAYAERYLTTGLLYWIGLALLLLDAAWRAPRRRQAAGLLALLLLQALLLAGLPRQWRVWSGHHGDLVQAAGAVISGTEDSEPWLRVHPNLPLVHGVYDLLRGRGGGPYAWPEAGWIGQPLAAVSPPLASGCDYGTRWQPPRRSADGNWALAGWTSDKAGEAPTAILRLDGAGRIAAVTWPDKGTLLEQRPPEVALPGWELWLSDAQRDTGQLVAVTPAGSCPLPWP